MATDAAKANMDLKAKASAKSSKKLSKKKLAVFKFASCDGCQLSLLDCEDELLAIADKVDIANFLEASSKIKSGPYDLTLVEGSITTAHDLERLREIRQRSKVLITIGACATAGGIQALRNFTDVREMASVVYARPEFINTLATSTPIAEHVKVDFELRGCPISKQQLLEVIMAFLQQRRPNVPQQSVCVECKYKGNACLAVTKKLPCMGPITMAGCQALCPSYNRACFGCYGPKENANVKALVEDWQQKGLPAEQISHLLRSFNAWSEPFRKESMKL